MSDSPNGNKDLSLGAMIVILIVFVCFMLGKAPDTGDGTTKRERDARDSATLSRAAMRMQDGR